MSAESLYNGIVLPEIWPPRDFDPAATQPRPVPWLQNPPKVVPISIGRQLFVDDFLIAHTTLQREFHSAQKFAGNPVFRAETALEQANHLPLAAPKSGGVWWDPADLVFKMWYEAGWLGASAYATSVDGIHWNRPTFDVVPGTNQILPELRPDSSTVFLDHATTDPNQRFKMFLRPPDESTGATPGYAMASADGVHWSTPQTTGFSGDRSTIFYNPFRRKWVFSLRFVEGGRVRRYHEHADFFEAAKWQKGEPVFWARADELDPPLPDVGQTPQLYNLDAVAYESLMLGLFEIHRGPTNEECITTGTPKATDLTIAFSRDGFHWHRPDRRPFIAGTRKPGDWDRGYVQSVGGVCLIVGDELWFYYIGFQGDQTNLHPDWRKNGMYANGSTGLAKLRRDGFASMNAGASGGILTTRPVIFEGSHLFVNVDCPNGELRAEILNEAGEVIAPFSLENSARAQTDSTCCELKWFRDFNELRGQPVRFRFHLTNGRLYAFWISNEACGASQGYVAAGGPAFTGATDSAG